MCADRAALPPADTGARRAHAAGGGNQGARVLPATVNRQLSSLRAKVEHPFRVIKRPFGYTRVRYRGLAKNTAQLYTRCALANWFMARRRLLAAPG